MSNRWHTKERTTDAMRDGGYRRQRRGDGTASRPGHCVLAAGAAALLAALLLVPPHLWRGAMDDTAALKAWILGLA